MKKSLLIVSLILILPLGLTAFPEMTPTSMDVEGVEPGDRIETDIFIGDDLGQNQTIEIDVSVSEVSSSSIFSDNYEDHDMISEQRISNWWTFEVEPLRTQNDFSPEGSDEVFEGKVEAILEVPDDAEPGLRYGSISLDPEVVNEGESNPGGQVGFAFSPRLPYAVKIEGSVQRDLNAQDVRAFRLDEDRVAIEVLMTNRGTVTTSFEDFELDVIDNSRNYKGSVIVSGGILEPGESRWFDATWSDDETIEEGSYEVDGEVNYFTGQSYASGSFSLPGFDTIEVRPEDSPATDEADSSLPIWLVLMILVVLGVLMWSFEIDPVWIFGIVGVLGISAFVLMSSVSNLLLVGVLIPVLLIVYLGV